MGLPRNPFKQVKDPPDPPAGFGVYVDQQRVAGQWITRFYCGREIPREFNDDIVAVIKAAVTTAPDTDFRTAIRIYLDYVAVSWMPQSDPVSEGANLEFDVVELLEKLYDAPIQAYRMPRDEHDMYVKLDAMASLRARLRVQWSPSIFQP